MSEPQSKGSTSKPAAQVPPKPNGRPPLDEEDYSYFEHPHFKNYEPPPPNPDEQPPGEPPPDWDPHDPALDDPAPEPPKGPFDTAETKKARATRTLHLKTAEDVEDKEVGWLWPRWLPHGFVWLEGDPGTNKSMLAVLLAALTTTGKPFPGESTERPPQNVLYLSSGEDPEQVIKARLRRAGGNTKRLFLLDVRKIMTDPNVPEPSRGLPELPMDTARIVETARSIEAALIILDAAYSFVSMKHDIFNDHQLRAALEPFARTLAEAEMVALGLRHTRKAEGAVQHQGLGAVAGGAVARATLVMNANPAAGPNARLLGCIKVSYGAPFSQQFAFEIQAESPIGTAWLVYTGQSEMSVSRASSLARNTKVLEAEKLYYALHKAFGEAFAASEKIPVHGVSTGTNVDAIALRAGYMEQTDFGRSRLGKRVKRAFNVEAVQGRDQGKLVWHWQAKSVERA